LRAHGGSVHEISATGRSFTAINCNSGSLFRAANFEIDYTYAWY
jgi:hypothetical protein